MDSQQAWQKILSEIPEEEREFQTAPIIKRQKRWFAVNRERDCLWVKPAMHNAPSSKLKARRKLLFKEFEKILPYYFKRAEGESVSKVVSKLTLNQVYYFSLIKHLLHR